MRLPCMVLKEDSCQIYKDNSAENWAPLSMLKAEPIKASIPAKQKMAWMKAAHGKSRLTLIY